ncbi:MAG: sugar ABC transporter permease [Frankiaceae bacterium]
MTGTSPEGTPTEALSAAEVDPRLIVQEQGLRGYFTAFTRKVSGGELGSLPVVIGLIVIWSFLQSQNSRFLSAENLTNLSSQMVATGTISVGIVLVLLLGEIDLSVGVVSGLAGAVLVVLNVNHGMGPVQAIVLALIVGLAIGAFQGFVFTRFGVPSFVVTLAGLIGWQGVQLDVLGAKGTVNLPFDGGVAKLANTYLSSGISWVLAILAIVGYAAAQLAEIRSRTRAGLRPRPMSELILRTAVVAASLAVAVAVLNSFQGVPLSLLIFLVFVVVFDLVIKKTTYGRHVLAVGGNEEAARRAGISVSRIRLSVFILASTMAAAGGVLAASRALSVGQSSGGGDVLLNAIAAAVIGGTSLFGGRGSAYSALLGILVIQSISNGLDLLNKASSTKFIITGAVLLIAVIVDALARRGRQARGRG